MKTDFKYELGQRLKMNVLDDCAEVYARGEWLHYGHSYLMRYLSKDGKVLTEWVAEPDLSFVTQ